MFSLFSSSRLLIACFEGRLLILSREEQLPLKITEGCSGSAGQGLADTQMRLDPLVFNFSYYKPGLQTPASAWLMALGAHGLAWIVDKP